MQTYQRVVPDFMVQWGISGDPTVTQQWEGKGNIVDDPRPPTVSNTPGTLSFATSGEWKQTQYMASERSFLMNWPQTG